jgi:flagellar operon protein
MVDGINNIVPGVSAPVVKPEAQRKTTAGSLSFNAVLEANLRKGSELKFSAHAQERLASRQIDLKPEDLRRLEEGVNRVASKGSRESLVLKDDLAFVVSVTNRTVITAVDFSSMKGNVFTNIDSAVIV